MIVKLLTEHHFEFLSLTGGCTGSSESTLVKMPHCWKSLVVLFKFPNVLAYCMSKSAVDQFTRCVALGKMDL